MNSSKLFSLPTAVQSRFESEFPNYLEELKTLARIPSVSFDGFPAGEVRRSAEAVADLLRRTGLENVSLLEVEGAHPYVYADWLHAPGAPTLLLYAHHDVQPPGRTEFWKTEPFEPTELQGPNGLRLYGRGTADDKAGVLVHVAAIDSWLKTTGKLPVNVRLVIEGEEEIGSEHLPAFLKKFRDRLSADVMVLTDTMNFDSGKPSLTVALRGLVGLEVEVRALTKTVHSGMWGGPVPDPVMALAKMLAPLTDESGRLALPRARSQVKALQAEEEARLGRYPWDEKIFRDQSGMVAGAQILREGPNPNAQIWRFPSLTVNAIQASSRAQAGNIINDTAWAKITIRLVADMDPALVMEELQATLRASVPWGLEVTFKPESANPAWSTDPVGPAFEAAEAAMRVGYGAEPLHIGCGGSIPFVRPFADALGGAPALLVGVEDPYTNAHGENESLLISDFKKACLSQTQLFLELSERLKKRS